MNEPKSAPADPRRMLDGVERPVAPRGEEKVRAQEDIEDQAELIGGKTHRKGPVQVTIPEHVLLPPSPQEGMSESIVKALKGFQKNKCICPSQSALSGQMYGKLLEMLPLSPL